MAQVIRVLYTSTRRADYGGMPLLKIKSTNSEAGLALVLWIGFRRAGTAIMLP